VAFYSHLLFYVFMHIVNLGYAPYNLCIFFFNISVNLPKKIHAFHFVDCCISFSRCKYTFQFHAKLLVFCLLLIKKMRVFGILLLINLNVNLIKYVYKLLQNVGIFHMYCKMYHRLFFLLLH
jgi:hypothetical protein